MIFKKKHFGVQQEPHVVELKLKKTYKFMYENFVLSTQQDLYLLLEEKDGHVETLKFPFAIFKYGYPNDEIGHPLMKYGLGFYGLFETKNSPWIEELLDLNRQHPRHKDEYYSNRRHFIAKFKDVTLEVIADSFEECAISKAEIMELFANEMEKLRE